MCVSYHLSLSPTESSPTPYPHPPRLLLLPIHSFIHFVCIIVLAKKNKVCFCLLKANSHPRSKVAWKTSQYLYVSTEPPPAPLVNCFVFSWESSTRQQPCIVHPSCMWSQCMTGISSLVSMPSCDTEDKLTSASHGLPMAHILNPCKLLLFTVDSYRAFPMTLRTEIKRYPCVPMNTSSEVCRNCATIWSTCREVYDLTTAGGHSLVYSPKNNK